MTTFSELAERRRDLARQVEKLRTTPPARRDQRRYEQLRALHAEVVERLQRHSRRLLDHALARALDTGQIVPCFDLVEEFTGENPETVAHLCGKCPALRECALYATTGAVQTGVLAGQKLDGGRWRFLQVHPDLLDRHLTDPVARPNRYAS